MAVLTEHMHSHLSPVQINIHHKDVEMSPNMEANVYANTEDIKVGQNHQDTVAVKTKQIKIKTTHLIKVLPDRVARCCSLKDSNSFGKELTFSRKRQYCF